MVGERYHTVSHKFLTPSQHFRFTSVPADSIYKSHIQLEACDGCWHRCAEQSNHVRCSRLVPLLSGSAPPHARQGAVQMVDALVKGLGTAIVPYLLLLVVPVMGRMSDPLPEVRQLATATFAPIVALLPLAQVTCSALLLLTLFKASLR